TKANSPSGAKDLQAFHRRQICPRRKRSHFARPRPRWRIARQFLPRVEEGFSRCRSRCAQCVSELVKAKRLFARTDFISRGGNVGDAPWRITKRNRALEQQFKTRLREFGYGGQVDIVIGDDTCDRPAR